MKKSQFRSLFTQAHKLVGSFSTSHEQKTSCSFTLRAEPAQLAHRIGLLGSRLDSCFYQPEPLTSFIFANRAEEPLNPFITPTPNCISPINIFMRIRLNSPRNKYDQNILYIITVTQEFSSMQRMFSIYKRFYRNQGIRYQEKASFIFINCHPFTREDICRERGFLVNNLPSFNPF